MNDTNKSNLTSISERKIYIGGNSVSKLGKVLINRKSKCPLHVMSIQSCMDICKYNRVPCVTKISLRANGLI